MVEPEPSMLRFALFYKAQKHLDYYLELILLTNSETFLTFLTPLTWFLYFYQFSLKFLTP